MTTSSQELEYLKDYKNCAAYCSYETTPEAISECINDIKTDFKNDELCKKQSFECDIIHSEKFRKIVNYLIRFLKILYCVRYYSGGNAYDIAIITSLGVLDLKKFGLTAQELTCVKLQDFVKKGMPDNLGDYLIVMQEIRKIIQTGKNLVTESKKHHILKQYDDFVSDYQPWTSLLYVCVDKYAKQLDLLDNIPDISKPSEYNSFVECTEQQYNDFIQMIHKPNEILKYAEHNNKRKKKKTVGTKKGKQKKKKKKTKKQKTSK